MEQDSNIELGGNISLVGFKEINPAEMVVVKKIVGNYSKRISELSPQFRHITISLKKVHGHEKSSKFEIACKVDSDRMFNSEVTEYNLFVALDLALKKIINSLS